MCSPALCHPINQLWSNLSAALKSCRVRARASSAQAWQTRVRGQCCHPHTCVYPDIANLSQGLYRHILLKCPHTFPRTQKPLKTLSRWSPTSSLMYCFNICRKSQHSKKELWESFRRLWRAALLMPRGEFSWKAIRQVIHTRSRTY